MPPQTKLSTTKNLCRSKIILNYSCKVRLVIHASHMQITATEFKAKCLALIDVVQRTGQPLIISKHGKKVVRQVAKLPAQPWKVLHGRGKFLSDPFAPAISESEIEALR